MFGQITIADYSSDWAMKDRNVDPRTNPGYLTREEVIESYSSLGIAGIELNHAYWSDYDPARLKQLAANARLPIVTYVAMVDLAVPAVDRRSALDEIFSILDRTAALGASRIFLIPAIFKPEFTESGQRACLIENLRLAAERAASMNLTILSENIDYPPARFFMGQGSDCLDICMKVDSALNYQGFLQIEYQGVDDPRIALKHNVAYLHGLLARLAPASGATRP